MSKEELILECAEFYKVLSDYTRLRIVCTLLKEEKCVSDIATEVGMNQSAISYQMKTLRQVHLVKYYRKGKNVFYSIDDDHVSSIINLTMEHLTHRHNGE